MTSDASEDALHFRGKTLTPESPRPLHFPEPHSIPILENQTDPAFTDTSTYENVLSDSKGDDFANIASEVEDPTHLTKQLFSRTVELFRNGTNALAAGDQNTASVPPAEDGGKETGDEATSIILPVDNLNANATTQEYASSVPHHGRTDLVQPDESSSLESVCTKPPLNSSLPPSDPPSHASTGVYQQPAEYKEEVPTSTRSESSVNDQAAEKTEPVSDGEVNLQSLLDNLSQQATTAPQVTKSSASTLSPVNDTNTSPMTEPSLPSGLPPRPPPQEKPSIHPNYSPTDDIRSFHPGSALNPNGPGHCTASNPHQLPAHSAVIEPAGAPGTTPASNGLPPPPPPPPTVALPLPSPTASLPHKPSHSEAQDDKLARSSNRDRCDDAPWGPEIQKKYDEFLHEERIYVTEGQWDRFPPGSRLFIGNLPSERVTKRDLFHIFHKYGKLAQISIKQAYGFVQFADASACRKALEAEQGGVVRGRKIHLEISKPQRTTRPGETQGPAGPRRSRSPDYDRGRRSSFDRHERGAEPGRPSFRERDRPELHRRRDDYRPPRSPSPRGFRRDEYRSRDRSLERDDRRSRRRSRSPYGRGGRYRSPSPRDDRGRGYIDDLDLPIPKRSPRSVPDVQVIVIENVDRDFIYRVERAFRDRGLRSDVLFLSPRIDLSAVIHRQIIEGVLAIVKISRSNQYSGKIPLQVFDHSHGVNDVRFNEYSELDLNVAVDVVLHSRNAQSTNAAVRQSQPLGVPVPAQHPQNSTAPLSGPNNIANLISALDGPTLQSLLSALQQQQQQPQHQPGAAAAPVPPQPFGVSNTNPTDLASLLSGASRTNLPVVPPPPANNPTFPTQNFVSPIVNPSNQPFAPDTNLASLLTKGLGAHLSNPSTQPNPQVQNIISQLAKWRQT
ncbi:hypothetical protein VTO42DRAFT_8591 [Malbranchea cinnamomea]